MECLQCDNRCFKDDCSSNLMDIASQNSEALNCKNVYYLVFGIIQDENITSDVNCDIWKGFA